jgi:hypothetical protein
MIPQRNQPERGSMTSNEFETGILLLAYFRVLQPTEID